MATYCEECKREFSPNTEVDSQELSPFQIGEIITRRGSGLQHKILELHDDGYCLTLRLEDGVKRHTHISEMLKN